MFILLELELLLNQIGLLDEVVDFVLEVFGYLVLLAHAMEILELLLLLLVFSLDLPDYGPYTADVVGEGDTAYGLNEDENDGLCAISG